ncbi:hypothetical protein BV22DRAFT_1033723 [Leucogyrophana mollusca]|uniref:Uncharacterized protein n=1 Tax=Leucogyrophana mollusca TaxID=85980 RepID=A0ACB8BIN4_9AGAM|nr:hypothetical protein BV22DRAFT_1033723 [Leucogyrophana mollusca]
MHIHQYHIASPAQIIRDISRYLRPASSSGHGRLAPDTLGSESGSLPDDATHLSDRPSSQLDSDASEPNRPTPIAEQHVPRGRRQCQRPPEKHTARARVNSRSGPSKAPALVYNDESLLNLEDPWPYTFQPGDKVWVNIRVCWVGADKAKNIKGRPMFCWLPGVVRKGRMLVPRVGRQLLHPNRHFYHVRVAFDYDREISRLFCPLDGNIKPDNHYFREIVRELDFLRGGFDTEFLFCYNRWPEPVIVESSSR